MNGIEAHELPGLRTWMRAARQGCRCKVQAHGSSLKGKLRSIQSAMEASSSKTRALEQQRPGATCPSLTSTFMLDLAASRSTSDTEAVGDLQATQPRAEGQVAATQRPLACWADEQRACLSFLGPPGAPPPPPPNTHARSPCSHIAQQSPSRARRAPPGRVSGQSIWPPGLRPRFAAAACP
jgi:hypothetical protein